MSQADFLDLAAFLAGAFRLAYEGAGFSIGPMLARNASIRLTTLSGVVFFEAVIGRPFCFFAMISLSAAS